MRWVLIGIIVAATAVGYVLVALAGKFLLHEEITARRWAGIVLIVAGVSLVSGGSPPRTEAHS